MLSIRFIPPTYLGGSDDNGFNIPNTPLIREHVQIVVNNTLEDARSILGIQTLDENC